MSRPRSIAGILITTAIVLVVLVVASQFFLAWRANARLSTKLADLKAAGNPTSLADLKPSPVPPADNAAAQLDAIAKDLKAFDKQLSGQFEITEQGKSWTRAIDKGEVPTPEQVAAVRAVLGNYPNILPALRRAAACRAYVPMNDVTQQSAINAKYLTEIQQTRALARFASAEMSSLAAEGQPDDAVRVGIDLLRVARHFDQEPFMVAYLVSLAIRTITITSISDVLQRTPISDEVSTELDNELAQHDLLGQFGKTLREERVYGIAALDEQVGEMAGGVANALHWPKVNWQIGIVDYYSTAIPLEKLQWFEGRATLTQAKLRADDAGPFAQQIFTGLDSSYQAANRITAQVRCLRILNALRQYLKQHGKPATRLADLSLAKADTIDPFTGQPLLLKHTDKGWIIYSVMLNGIDDGGDFKSLKDYGVGPPGHEYDAAADQAAEESETDQKSEVP